MNYEEPQKVVSKHLNILFSATFNKTLKIKEGKENHKEQLNEDTQRVDHGNLPMITQKNLKFV
jgi:hypothetical protein